MDGFEKLLDFVALSKAETFKLDLVSKADLEVKGSKGVAGRKSDESVKECIVRHRNMGHTDEEAADMCSRFIEGG